MMTFHGLFFLNLLQLQCDIYIYIYTMVHIFMFPAGTLPRRSFPRPEPPPTFLQQTVQDSSVPGQLVSQLLSVWLWHRTTHTHHSSACVLVCFLWMNSSVRGCVCVSVCLHILPPRAAYHACTFVFARCVVGMPSSFNNHNRPGPALLDHVRDNQPMEHLTDLSRAIGFCAADR